MVTVADFGCGYDYVGAGKRGHCNTDTTTSDKGTRSANMVAFQTAFGKSNYYYWTNDSYGACGAYYVYLGDGEVNYYGLNAGDYSYALCRVGD